MNQFESLQWLFLIVSRGNQVVYFAVSFNFHTSHKTQEHTVVSLQACHLYAAFHIVKRIPDGR